MARTTLTHEDVKNIFARLFNGYDEPAIQTDGTIVHIHKNPNSEKILLKDEDGNNREVDIAEYLGIKFYTWKERLIETKNDYGMPAYSSFDDWVKSIEFSMDKSYALIEPTDEEITTSQDIDSATKVGRITFIVQSDKASNLDYYLTKLRNTYIGNPQKIENSYGEIVSAYILLGIMVFDEEPGTIQFGECIRVSVGFKISYLSDAFNYSDQTIEISLDGDDDYDSDGKLIGETKYLTMPITRQTWQVVFGSNPLPMAARPDITGFLATTLSSIKTLAFFDFNKTLAQRINDLFWSCGAYRINGKLTAVTDINIPIFIRVTVGNNSYVYKDMIENMEKVITNNDFNVSSITLKSWGKLDNTISEI